MEKESSHPLIYSPNAYYNQDWLRLKTRELELNSCLSMDAKNPSPQSSPIASSCTFPGTKLGRKPSYSYVGHRHPVGFNN